MNLYMMCRAVRPGALSDLPEGFLLRPLRPEELAVWLDFPFDTASEALENRAWMQAYYDRVYRPRAAEFHENCQVVCCADDQPLSTCFLWRAYGGRMLTLHWLKTRKDREGLGLGRALLSRLLSALPSAEFPVYLHTHPECVAAIKLYSDFGFELIEGPVAGERPNDLEAGLDFLKQAMKPGAFQGLKTCRAPRDFYSLAAISPAEF